MSRTLCHFVTFFPIQKIFISVHFKSFHEKRGIPRDKFTCIPLPYVKTAQVWRSENEYFGQFKYPCNPNPARKGTLNSEWFTGFRLNPAYPSIIVSTSSKVHPEIERCEVFNTGGVQLPLLKGAINNSYERRIITNGINSCSEFNQLIFIVKA